VTCCFDDAQRVRLCELYERGFATFLERCRLEWIHETGELVLFGGVPELGTVSAEMPERSAGAAALTPGGMGGTVGSIEREGDGIVREFFTAEELPADARVAVLGTVEHGPRVHELLWGWHLRHRRADGWDWLVDRLAALG